MKRSPLKKKSKSEVSQIKDRIQALCREIAIKRDGGCVLRERPDAGQCGGYRTDGELILQYDHLITRARNISYADTRLGVALCLAHHGGFKQWHKEKYDRIVKEVIGPYRTALWERVELDNRAYPMGLADWKLIEIALQNELND